MERSGFFNAEEVTAGVFDREYFSEDYAKCFSHLISNGVFPNPATYLQVVAQSPASMSLTMLEGFAWIEGFWYESTGNTTISISPADGILNRVDAIVLTLNYSQRSIHMSCVKGTPASTAVAPTPVRSADVYQLVLAHVSVPAGATNVSQAKITDTRINTEVCGWVTGLVQNINTTALYNQIQADMAEFKGTEQSSFNSWSVAQKAAFDSWFSTIQNILDGNAAGNLLSIINTHKNDKTAHNNIVYNATAVYANGVNTLTLKDAPAVLSMKYIVSFDAPTNAVDADKISVGGDVYPILMSGEGSPPVTENMYTAGQPILLSVNTSGAYFSGGGGGMAKSFQQLKVPVCGKSRNVATSYASKDTSTGTGQGYRNVVLGNKNYSIGNNSLSERNLDTDEYKLYTFPGITNYTTYSIDVYNDELYCIGNNASTSAHLQIYKLNLLTLTRTLYFDSSTTQYFNSAGPHIMHIADDKILIGSRHDVSNTIMGYREFNYTAKTLTDKMVVSATYLDYTGVEQQLPNGDWLLGLATNASPCNLAIFKYFASTGQMSYLYSMPLPTSPAYLQSHQIGSTLLWISNSPMNSSLSGELDLENKTINYTKYPQPPFNMSPFGTFTYHNQLIRYENAKKYTLNLLVNPPEQNPIALMILRGQKFNAPFGSLTIDAIPNQAEFIIDGTTKVAVDNIEIHLGQYGTISEFPINVWRD